MNVIITTETEFVCGVEGIKQKAVS